MSPGSECGEGLLEEVRRYLLTYPLCDRCLGRLFAKYGLNLDNKVRGASLKTLLSMCIHSEILSGSPTCDEECLKKLAENAGYPLTEIHSRFGRARVSPKKCYVCGGRIEELLSKLTQKALSKLREVDFETFIVGVKSGSQIELRYDQVVRNLSVTSWESVRREFKRVVGKKIQGITGKEPDFRAPDVVVLLDLDSADVEVIPTPLYIYGSYVKLGRLISQMVWIGKDGVKKYKLSVEEVLRGVKDLVDGEEVKIHASGREDVDVRMLGSGRPTIVEVRGAKRRSTDLGKISMTLSRNPWVKFKALRRARPPEVRILKEENSRKVYRAVVYSQEPLTEEDVELIESKLSNALIRQRTPRRVLWRRKDLIRKRMVYEVRGKLITPRIMELIIFCDGGLYVKELIHGDEGRTKPSVAEVLGRELTVLLLDVLSVTTPR